ncbi:hypothetical protein [Streptomyces sp. SD15]
MRMHSWKFRLGLVVSTALIGGGAMAPAATAAPMPQTDVTVTNAAQHLPAAPKGDGNSSGGGRFVGNGEFGDIQVGSDSVRIGDRVCAGNCSGTVNGSNGSNGGICAGVCNGSANGGNGTNGGPGRNGTNGGNGGICAGVCGGSANGGNGGNGGDAVNGGDGGNGGKGGNGGTCTGTGCQTSGQGGRGGNGGNGGNG